ncbi:MAG: NlpC/P60 family protein [Pseudonocardiaceae bacterium]|nr:NlpC/P60 family protein [Pseudonocardiaceae bacterium]
MSRAPRQPRFHPFLIVPRPVFSYSGVVRIRPRRPSVHAWQRGAVGRGIVVLGLVAVLGLGGWLVAQSDRDDEAAAKPAGRKPVPSVLMASAPLDAQAPTPLGPELNAWIRDMARKLEIPERALIGYANAELELRDEMPGCELSWITLAGIGKAASDHGRIGDRTIESNGATSPPIGTVPLGVPGGEQQETSAAEGPMQLSPELWDEWRRSARDGREADVQNIDDAALTAGRALCAGGRNTSDGRGWWQAIESYHDSELFLQRVLANANLYAALASSDVTPSSRAVRAVKFAIGQLGLPYVWGGNGPQAGAKGFDCSGLTTAAYARAGVQLPRTAHWQFGAVPRVRPDEEPQLGDLVFYGNPNTKIHHVGLYIGNNLMINAPTFGQAVQIHNYRSEGDDYAGAGRPAN